MGDSGLDLAFDDVQQALGAAIGQLCADHCGDADLRAGAGQFPEALWKQIAELGVLALATPEGEGGALELVAVLEALGEAAFPGPLAATLFAAQLLGGAEARAVASGERVVSVGADELYPFAARADLFLEVEGTRVFRVEPEARLAAVETLGGEPWGRLRCRRMAELPEPERAFALHDLALAAFLAALGLRLVRDTAQHATARRQFGRAIGEFQAVAHPLADRLIQLQAAQVLARRAACDFDALAREGEAARGAAAALLELRCAAGAARLSARRAALDAAHVCHQLFGAVGITLEGPVFERSRRILQLASALPGDASARAALEQSLAALETPERPGEAPPRERAVNFGFSASQEAFRAEVREFLSVWRDLDGFFGQGRKWERVRALFRALGERGWLSLGWPREWGGAAEPLVAEYLLWEEIAYARAARNPLAPGIVAKTLARYGSDAQKHEWLPRIQRGEIHFSLGYSEPEAGSDLASVRCRAERRGDRYIVSGQKCWQSYAQDMDYLWLLCRTGSQESRGRGLTLLIVDLQAPGVRVGALPTLDGDQLNEIHLDRVEVPLDWRVGPEDGAWKIMGEALADERHIQFPPGRVRRDLEEVVAWARRSGLWADASARRRLGELAVEVREVEVSGLRVLDAMRRGQPGAVEAAANKVLHTVVCQNIARTALELGGPAALVCGERVELLWRQSLWETIGGGTSEIMRGVVAKQALGLGGRS